MSINDEKHDDKVFEEVKLLYPIYMQNIEDPKQKQWQLAYYNMVLQGAIIGFRNMINIWFLVAASFIIFLLSCTIVYIYYCDIQKYRVRKTGLILSFTPEIKSILNMSCIKDNCTCDRDISKYAHIIFYITFLLVEIFVIPILLLKYFDC